MAPSDAFPMVTLAALAIGIIFFTSSPVSPVLGRSVVVRKGLVGFPSCRRSPGRREVFVRLIKDPNLLNNLGDQGGSKKAPGQDLIGMGSDPDKVEWDPEGILGPRQSGHIARIEAQHAEQRNKAEYDRIVAKQKQEAEIARKRRDARIKPDVNDKEAVIEYFLDTNPEDMEHEIARMRPAITPELINYLDETVNITRLNPEPKQAELDQMYEYEALSQVLKEGIIIFDTQMMEALQAQKNVRFILSAKDKKKAILELAGKNAIDETLISLMESNAQAAKGAGQEKIAEFIIKLRDDMSRYIIKPIEVPLRDKEIAEMVQEAEQEGGSKSGGVNARVM